MQLSRTEQIAKLDLLRDLKESGKLDEMFRLGIISHTQINYIELHDLYHVHLKVCPSKPVKATAEVSGYSVRWVRKVLFGR